MSEKTKTLRIRLNTAKSAGIKWAAKRAIALIKKDIQKHTRKTPEQIRISKGVNEAVWKNGSYNLPRQVDLDLLEEKDIVYAFLKNTNEKESFLKTKKEKEHEKKKETKSEKTKAETKEAQQKEEEQAQKLEEKRMKESIAEKAEYK